MAVIKVVDVIDRAETLIQDTTNIRWPKAEWLNWFNDAILAVVNLRPDASVKNESFTTTAAVAKQSIPATGLKLIEIISNVNTGRAIRLIPRAQLDDQIPTWQKTAGTDVEHYCYDDRDPKTFYIYPQPASAHDINIVYSSAPAAISISDFETDTTVMPLDDSYLNPILDFMLYRAYSKDAEYAENAARAQSHMAAFNGQLTGKFQADMAISPKASS